VIPAFVVCERWIRRGVRFWLRIRRLLHKVAGTLLTNCIPATPIELSLEEVMIPTLAPAKKARTLDRR
jgi:hypothetical protein